MNSSALSTHLDVDGFLVIPSVLPLAQTRRLAHLYDGIAASASPDDIKVGSTTIRVRDFVNRDPEFDELYLCPLIIQAARRVIQGPLKLSTLHARTVKPRADAQQLHVDFPSDSQGWPMLGFIWMLDAFTSENGATRFLPRSQGAKLLPDSMNLVSACGPAGSVIVYNGSIWHGHGSNPTAVPRRSIQGAYIRRTETSGENLASRIRQETCERIGPLGRYLLAL